MKSQIRVITFAFILSILYYLGDTFLDKAFSYNDLSFFQVLIVKIPIHELYTRILGMSVIIFGILLSRLVLSKSEDLIKKQLSSAQDFLVANDPYLLSDLTHQVKDSLNAIIGFSDLLKDPKLSKESNELYLNQIHSSGGTILEHLNNAGNITKTGSQVNLNRVLTDLNKKYESELKHRAKNKLDLKLHIPDEYEELIITTDQNKLISILECLLQNAIGFTDSGTINYGYLIDENKEIQFFFHDQGAGISMEQLETDLGTHVKNPDGMDTSYQLAATRMEVAKRLAIFLKGKVWSKSELGSGSSFYLTLATDKQSQDVPKEELQEELRPDWQNYKILIAEDIDANFLLLKTFLAITNAEVIRAKNGSEAVDIFRNNSESIDAVLMDIIMPEMDGFEAASRIKEQNNAVPIIGQTAYCLESEKEDGKLLQFDDFLTKPIWNHELILTLSKYLK